MGILIDKEVQMFHLKGKESSYIFHVDNHGHLLHDYYGKGIKKIPKNWLNSTVSRQWSPIPYEKELDYALDSALLECPVTGHDDFGIPMIEAQFNQGDRSIVLTYEDYELVHGKPSLTGLPHSYGGIEEAQTLSITMVDKLRKIRVELNYCLFEDSDILTRWTKIFNDSENEIFLDSVQSGGLDLKGSNYEMLQLSGAWGRERHVVTRELVQGQQSIDSNRGASSHEHNPFIALTSKDITEEHGEVFAFNLVYSGNFSGTVEVNEHDRTRLTMGISPRDFRWKLRSGEEFCAPELIMTYSSKGLGLMSRNYHDFYNNHLIRGVYKKAYRPILINNWEVTYFDFDHQSIVDIASSASDLGIGVFVLDDGWFGKRDDDTTSLGDWVVNEEKLQGGLKALAGGVLDHGMKFGLWFEPEMISRDSDLYRKHPEWVLRIPDRDPVEVRYQFTLDLSREDVCDYIIKSLSDILASSSIEYVKWDMNRYMTDVYSRLLDKHSQMETAHRYILGLYRVMETLVTNFPNILFEGCAGGGGRFDPGILYYMPQIWTSDNTDAIERLKIQFGTSIVYPPSAISCHVSDVPNHQVGRVTPLKTRGDVAMFGNFGYELDMAKIPKEDIFEVKRQISFYNKHWKLLQYGTLYRLTSWDNRKIVAWSKVSKDKKEAIVTVVKLLAMPNSHDIILKIKGLDPDSIYMLDGGLEAIGGDVLSEVGLLLPHLDDFESHQYYIKCED